VKFQFRKQLLFTRIDFYFNKNGRNTKKNTCHSGKKDAGLAEEVLMLIGW